MNPYAHIPKNFDTMEVGAYYMDGRGDIEKCIAHNPDESENFQFITETRSYHPTGNYYGDGRLSVNDLTHRVNPDGSLWIPERESKVPVADFFKYHCKENGAIVRIFPDVEILLIETGDGMEVVLHFRDLFEIHDIMTRIKKP